MRKFVYVASENRYVLKDVGEDFLPNTPEIHRTFHQAAVLHTSEDQIISLTRAYDLEDKIAINDAQLEKGAKERGQKIGDVSGGNHLKDNFPEEEY